MQYAILFYEDQQNLDRREGEDAEQYWASWGSYIGAVQASGVVVAGAGLLPPATATSVQHRDDERVVQDGPYPDTKEHLGGFLVIEVDDLDAALEWAARAPSASYAGVEVRPVLPPQTS